MLILYYFYVLSLLRVASFRKSRTIALAEAALAFSAFWKTHSNKLIPNWTRNPMINYTNFECDWHLALDTEERRAGKLVQERRQLRKLNIQTVISHHRRRPQKQSRTANCANLSYLKPIQQSNPGCHKIRFAVWNGQSINNKASIICDIILSNHLDTLAVTETWLCSWS